MSAQHTPGPWELKQFGGPQISGPNGYAVCTMWGALSVDELAGQDAANARLIAAAPELLSCLEIALETLVNEGVCDKGCWSCEAAQAVVAKARGEVA